MGRWFDATVTLLVHLCAALLIGQVIVAAHLWIAWKITPDRLATMLQVAKGNLPDATGTSGPAEEDTRADQPPEEPSYDAILKQRALEYRDLELRDMALQSDMQELSLLKEKVTQQSNLLAQQADQFRRQIAQVQQAAEEEGLDTVRRTLESIKPDQAKQFVLDMLDEGEEDALVALLEGMDNSRRARILGTFETPEETEQIANVLRRIREGGQAANAADTAEQVVDNIAPPGTQ